MRAALGLFLIVVPLAVSCRTARLASGSPFVPLAARTAEEAWSELANRASAFAGARAFARAVAVSGEQRRSVRLTLVIRADGSFEVDVLTPVGTRAAALSVRDREVILRDSGQRRPIAELGKLTGLSLGNRNAREIAMLLLGLPAHDHAEADRGGAEPLVVRAQGVDYEVGNRGLVQVRDGQTVIRYDPPVFPPSKVQVLSGSGQFFELEYLELLETRI